MDKRPYMRPCPGCGEIKISSCLELCSSCSNKEYSRKLHAGEIKVLTLDMTKIKQSTYLKIKALIAEDME